LPYLLNQSFSRHIKKGKYPVYMELHTSFYGAREFAITDVDGYVLTFTKHKDV